jgi:hypothetical protein
MKHDKKSSDKINMKIQRANLKDIAKLFLGTLDEQGVETFEDLVRLEGQAFVMPGDSHHYLPINWKPSNFGTRALDVSYLIAEEGGGLPICVKINPSLFYSRIFAKCQTSLPDYKVLTKDPTGNIHQTSILDTTDWSEIRKKVEELLR